MLSFIDKLLFNRDYQYNCYRLVFY